MLSFIILFVQGIHVRIMFLVLKYNECREMFWIGSFPSFKRNNILTRDKVIKIRTSSLHMNFDLLGYALEKEIFTYFVVANYT